VSIKNSGGRCHVGSGDQCGRRSYNVHAIVSIVMTRERDTRKAGRHQDPDAVDQREQISRNGKKRLSGWRVIDLR